MQQRIIKVLLIIAESELLKDPEHIMTIIHFIEHWIH